MAYEMLSSPMNIGSLTIRNRTVMTAAEISLGQINGEATEMMMNYYEERAKGGVGMIITGCCRVDDMNPASFTQLGMTHDYQIESVREMANRIHKHGAKLCIQLHHAGRQGYGCCNNSIPLVIPVVKAFPGVSKLLFKCAPALYKLEQEKKITFTVQSPSGGETSRYAGTRLRAMSKREVKKEIKNFIDAAERCKKAGVDAIELHAAHGYLLQQFMSPHTNKRTDEYGGSFENRMRFIDEIIAGIRQRCGKDFPLIVRISADEMYDRIGRPGVGYGLETGIEIAKHLEAQGVDAINVSSATYDAYNYWLETTSFEPGWRKHLAKAVKENVSIPVIAANLVRSPEQAEQQLQEGYQDFIGSARNWICDPHWLEKAQSGHPEDIRRCIGCVNCMRSMVQDAALQGTHACCALNMGVAEEKAYFNMPQDGEGRLVVVVGAGPAGLTAANTLAMRGFKVIVLEKGEKAGGQVITAAACHLKDKLYWSIEDLMTAVKKQGVEVQLNTEATAESIMAMNPYAVVVATGGEALRPGSIPGINRENVYVAPELIMGEVSISDSSVVVVGSGITGLETAELLGMHNNKVTVLEMGNEIAPGGWHQVIDDELERINHEMTEFKLSSKLLGIGDGFVEIENIKTKKSEKIVADYVLLSMGVRPINHLAKQLEGKTKVVTVGDAVKSGTIANACHSAYDTVMTIK